MYGGDESAALVVDVGYDSTKAGYAGEDCPKMVFSSALGVLPAEDGSRRYSVDEMHFPTPGLEASSAFSSDGLISDWQGYEQVGLPSAAQPQLRGLQALARAARARRADARSAGSAWAPALTRAAPRRSGRTRCATGCGWRAASTR